MSAGILARGAAFREKSGAPLSRREISTLKTGDRVTVIWCGGNGPHEYKIRNDLDSWERYRTVGVTAVEELMDGYHEVWIA